MNTLRQRIQRETEIEGCSLKKGTVLSTKRDPYRLDTPAGHTKGQWLRDAYNECHDGSIIHLRGLHYKLVGRVNKPDGSPYANNDKTWKWFSEEAIKCARYLGYIPWTALRDARNAPPQVFTPRRQEPFWWLRTAEIELELPDNLEPRLALLGDLYQQPYRQIVIAEKQGVRDLLLPICERRKATLCLPGGELSDQMMYDMLAEAAEDGRPVAIHQLGDFDPAGWQMAISTSRTVQALVDSQFPDMHVRVHAIGLTRDHCEEWDLPSSPLKETEMRGTAWKAAMGREQTELDAAVALAPDEFAEVVDNSLLQYFDTKVAKEAALTMIDAEIAANKKLTESIGLDTLQRIREEAESKLDDLTEQVDQVNDALRIDPGEVGIEMPEVPEILVGDVDESDHPLLDTDEDWMEQTTQLRDRKGYI